jgi:4-amino-4-deoxy-L-arabinose transferase-like glycosyltransferase
MPHRNSSPSVRQDIKQNDAAQRARTAESGTASAVAPGVIPRSSRIALGLILVAFVIIRAPILFRHYGGQDEEWYAVPGLTVAQSGIPRVPYAPSRRLDSCFYKVDEALLALPPAYFYWQAPFFWALPAGYGTARLASAVAGMIAVGLVYLLGRRLAGRELIGLFAAGLYSFSRVLYFPAITARPDILCGMLGLAALWLTACWQSNGRRRTLAAAGAALGLGMLTHPFAIVYCLQVGVWVLLGRRGAGLKQRLQHFALLVGCALAAFSLWAPLILTHTELFRVQFFNNVLNRSGPGLLWRLLVPWESLAYHGEMLLEHAQAIQLSLMAGGLLAATALAWRRGQPGARLLVALAWSSCYLLAAVQGPHPTKGYWCYPGALLFLCLAYAVAELSDLFLAHGRWAVGGRLLVGALLLAPLLPGAGLRAWLAHLQHWSDINYNEPQFTQALLRDLPAEARLIVDPAFVFDVYLSGRRAVVGRYVDFYFNAQGQPYDYLIVGPLGRQYHVADGMHARRLRDYGNADDLFACYAEVYVPASD